MRTGGVSAGGGVDACNAAGARWWSVLSRTRCAVTRMSASRVLLQAAAWSIGLLLRSQTGIGTPRSLQGRAVSAICRLIGRLIDRWGRLTRAWGSKWTPATLAGSIAHRQAA